MTSAARKSMSEFGKMMLDHWELTLDPNAFYSAPEGLVEFKALGAVLDESVGQTQPPRPANRPAPSRGLGMLPSAVDDVSSVLPPALPGAGAAAQCSRRPQPALLA